MNIPILIPAYNPNDTLISIVSSLVQMGAENVFVVNDGSKQECQTVFDELENIAQCHVLQHAVNLGKGAALKTGFNHILVNYPDAQTIVTADADGQHSAHDVMRVAEAAAESPGSLVLGTRFFSTEDPLARLLGNQITRAVMRFFTGIKLADTQTGLRAWPRNLCKETLKIPINGYDFEMEGLIRAKKSLSKDQGILEVPIETIYDDGVKSSHFNPLLDSMKIYFVFIRYSGTAMTASLLDYLLFALFYRASENILISLIAARSIAVSVAYLLARNIVFKSTEPVQKTVQLYGLAVIGYMFISYGSIRYMNSFFGINAVVAKLITEGIMFFASFAIQRDFIFKEKQEGIKNDL